MQINNELSENIFVMKNLIMYPVTSFLLFIFSVNVFSQEYLGFEIDQLKIGMKIEMVKQMKPNIEIKGNSGWYTKETGEICRIHFDGSGRICTIKFHKYKVGIFKKLDTDQLIKEFRKNIIILSMNYWIRVKYMMLVGATV